MVFENDSEWPRIFHRSSRLSPDCFLRTRVSVPAVIASGSEGACSASRREPPSLFGKSSSKRDKDERGKGAAMKKVKPKRKIVAKIAKRMFR